MAKKYSSSRAFLAGLSAFGLVLSLCSFSETASAARMSIGAGQTRASNQNMIAAATPRLSFSGWAIRNFDVTLKLQPDSSMLVNEHIEADFTQEEHHGITRNIPIRYTDDRGFRSSIFLSNIKVTNEKNQPWHFEENWNGDDVDLKIGDADTFLHGIETYNISYKAERAMTFFDDHDEMYWNAIGTEWEAPIEKATTTLILPTKVDPKKLRTACYTGIAGSSEKNCTAVIKDGSTFYYEAKANVAFSDGENWVLQAYEGMSIVAGFPKGLFPEPSQTQKILWFLEENWGFGLPIVVFFVLLWLWYTKGRDAKADRTTIMPTYTPPDGLSPSEVGTLIDERVDIRDISSGIIDLAIRGYLKIVEKKEKVLLWDSIDYEFHLLKPFEGDTKLKNHEIKTLKAIFKDGESVVKLSDLKNSFYSHIPKIKEQIYTALVKQGYFLVSPEQVRKIYLGIGTILIILSIATSGFLIVFLSLSVMIGIFLSGVLFSIFSIFMPARTKKGVEAKYQILGLQEYINTAEKDRLKFQEKENVFEKILPYAMALNIADKWTKAFDGIYKTPPTWYQSSTPFSINTFSTYQFASMLSHMSSSMNSALTSAPRSSGSGFSSGGGFSGGGGGGGGGGAW